MELSLFQGFDNIRFERARGDITRTFARVVFGMMFFLRRSDNPEHRKQLMQAEEYCRNLVPTDTYNWAVVETPDNLTWLDLRKAGNDAKAYELWQRQAMNDDLWFGLFDFTNKDGEAAGHALEIRALGLRFPAKEQDFFQFNFPLPWLERQDRPGLAQKIFRDLADILQPLHAQSGLCMTMTGNPSWTQGEGAESLYPLLRKYPGLIAGRAADMTFSIGDDMLPINWLNAVHNDLLDRCGGREAVLAQLGLTGFEFWDYDNGIVVQAGPAPLLGNRETGEKMPHYGALARALKPARISEYGGKGKWSIVNYRRPNDKYDKDQRRETLHEYLTRFDDM
ncbi:Protein of unknown function [Paracoccus halophilus]|uniref:DUF3396 domain-containing protein n=1 Tax=Paracoccus halophilus TaxID=376733 RepID=A0A099EZV9_9RHOB|nr:type VI immunity family protein [Paracoccus halophilus]KGJ03779.1 hypothetical protein IT41_12615 [Paracoccus halophilus]SFA56816.1 Protein of unknown function [Paracoccus halophilus]